jgi:hypothetical protein
MLQDTRSPFILIHIDSIVCQHRRQTLPNQNEIPEDILQDELDTALDAELREYDDTFRTVGSAVRVYVLGSVAISIIAWDLAFHYAIYDTIFFERLFVVWVACTATLIASAFLPKRHRFLKPVSVIALLIPSIWLLTTILIPEDESTLTELLSSLVQLATLLSLPYLGFALLFLAQPDTFRLPVRLRVGMFVVALVIALSGFWLGSNHPYVLDCWDFEVSGNYVPENCTRP